MSSFYGIVSGAGSVALGILCMMTSVSWKVILGIIFITCGLLSLLDYIRYGNGPQ